MSAIIFDTETTSAEADREIIEAGWIPLNDFGNIAPPTNGGYSTRFRPIKPITMGAMAVHHIMDEDLLTSPPSAEFALPEGVTYIIGHKVDFDWETIGKPDVRRICTLAMARKVWPDADSHTLGALTYLTRRESARRMLKDAHSALQDCWTCLKLLRAIYTMAGPFESIEALWRYSEAARIPDRMTFGKHKGMAITDLPADYKRWLSRLPDVDPYLKKALEIA